MLYFPSSCCRWIERPTFVTICFHVLVYNLVSIRSCHINNAKMAFWLTNNSYSSTLSLWNALRNREIAIWTQMNDCSPQQLGPLSHSLCCYLFSWHLGIIIITVNVDEQRALNHLRPPSFDEFIKRHFQYTLNSGLAVQTISRPISHQIIFSCHFRTSGPTRWVPYGRSKDS